MLYPIAFTLSYVGNDADEHKIDFYDIAQALTGFERSLAITTHLILNGEVITQAPSLKGARIIIEPPSAGSWEVVATILYGAYLVGTAPKDTPIGHLIHSAYDYIVSETLGFPVDYDKTLGQQYKELRQKDSEVKLVTQSNLDSVIDKTEKAITNMHRPIAWSKSAISANITSKIGSALKKISHPLNIRTFDHIYYSEKSENLEEFIGEISSYNLNTYKGRIYISGSGINRPVPFELTPSARNPRTIVLVTGSLAENAKKRHSGQIVVQAYRITSRAGVLKSLSIARVSAD